MFLSTHTKFTSYLLFCCDVYVVQCREMLLLNSTAGNPDLYAHGAMVSSSYVRYWIFIVGRKRSIRPCYGWPTWHTRDPRRERRTGDYTHNLPLHWFSLHLSSLNVSLCVFYQGEIGPDGPKGDRGEPGMTVRTNRLLWFMIYCNVMNILFCYLSLTLNPQDK